MSNYKVCVYAICKNEEPFAERWMKSMSEADLVVALDTGSTDGTVAKLREAGAKVYSKKITPWRFDAARNLAMKHIPADFDICVSTDLDEIFEPGWREKLEAAWTPGCTRARYLYIWSRNPDGTPDRQFDYEKIHSRQGFRWVHPVHEVLEYSGALPDNIIRIPGIVLHHFPDPNKPRSQYLPLLELSAKENPDDDRTAFWLGREYFFHENYELSIETLKRYLRMPAALWDEERSAAMRFIARAYENLEDYASQRKWLLRAAAEAPGAREPFLQLAQLGYRESDWVLVFWAVSEGLAVTQKSGSYLVESEAWGEALYDYGAIAAYRLGNYDKALEYARAACARAPGDARLRHNLSLIENARELSGSHE